ncbi:MAG: biotin transporter BioY [Ruminococcus sp.]|nr:biotin transporter BioY [Ruminococcus sp.]
MKLKNMILVAIFAALSAVGAFIKIPTPFCPITLQILFTTLAGVLLGGRNGALSVGIYVILGLVGLPVFTGGGGLSYVFYPTFGYLLGFILGAFVTGTICRGGEPKFSRLLTGCLAGMVIIFAIGTLYDLMITFLYLRSSAAVATVVFHCLLPLPGDVVLCVFTAFLGKRLIPIIERMDNHGRKNAC